MKSYWISHTQINSLSKKTSSYELDNDAVKHSQEWRFDIFGDDKTYTHFPWVFKSNHWTSYAIDICWWIKNAVAISVALAFFCCSSIMHFFFSIGPCKHTVTNLWEFPCMTSKSFQLSFSSTFSLKKIKSLAAQREKEEEEAEEEEEVERTFISDITSSTGLKSLSSVRT